MRSPRVHPSTPSALIDARGIGNNPIRPFSTHCTRRAGSNEPVSPPPIEFFQDAPTHLQPTVHPRCVSQTPAVPVRDASSIGLGCKKRETKSLPNSPLAGSEPAKIRVTPFHFSTLQTTFLIPLCIFLVRCTLGGVPGLPSGEPLVRQHIDLLCLFVGPSFRVGGWSSAEDTRVVGGF